MIANINFYLTNLKKLFVQLRIFNSISSMELEEVRSSKFWIDKAKATRSYGGNFLWLPHIKSTMFVDAGGQWMKLQLAELNKQYKPPRLSKILKEEPIGLPNIKSLIPLTSHNSIHHLYHLHVFERESKKKMSDITHVIEFGGGYGNMAKIVHRINKKIVYVILDLPEFINLQYRYLSTIFGKDVVKIVDNVTGSEKGGIYLLRNYQKPECKVIIPNNKRTLFLAAWSLSEVDKKTQNLISEKKFFNAEFLFFGYQQKNKNFKFSESYSGNLKGYKMMYNKVTPYISRNYYSLYKKF